MSITIQHFGFVQCTQCPLSVHWLALATHPTLISPLTHDPTPSVDDDTRILGEDVSFNSSHKEFVASLASDGNSFIWGDILNVLYSLRVLDQ